ncbi:MAG: hypothetical protein N4R28_04555 [Lactobacillus iners]|nr:hypothetical protein [Lactobacillus iners]MCT7782638.1 hypothetical protein [Lactobacillus iners]
MNKKNKKSLAKLGVILISATILSACGNIRVLTRLRKILIIRL